jgi:hypothetical protein
MDTFAVRLKWEGNPVAIVFRVDKDHYKGWPNLRLLEKGEKADRLLVWVNDGWVYVTSRDIW